MKDNIRNFTDYFHRCYYNELLNNKYKKGTKEFDLILKNTIFYFAKLEEYEKCIKLKELTK